MINCAPPKKEEYVLFKVFSEIFCSHPRTLIKREREHQLRAIALLSIKTAARSHTSITCRLFCEVVACMRVGRSSLLDLSSLAFGFALGLLLLDVLREELLVLFVGLSSALGLSQTTSLHQVLAAEAGLSDEALDLRALVEGLVATLDFAADNVATHIVLLLVETEGLHDAHAGLGALAVGALDVGAASDVLLALLHDAEEDGGEVGVDDAAADRLALAVTITARLEGGAG